MLRRADGEGTHNVPGAVTPLYLSPFVTGAGARGTTPISVFGCNLTGGLTWSLHRTASCDNSVTSAIITPDTQRNCSTANATALCLRLSLSGEEESGHYHLCALDKTLSRAVAPFYLGALVVLPCMNRERERGERMWRDGSERRMPASEGKLTSDART